MNEITRSLSEFFIKKKMEKKNILRHCYISIQINIHVSNTLLLNYFCNFVYHWVIKEMRSNWAAFVPYPEIGDANFKCA